MSVHSAQGMTEGTCPRAGPGLLITPEGKGAPLGMGGLGNPGEPWCGGLELLCVSRAGSRAQSLPSQTLEQLWLLEAEGNLGGGHRAGQ